MSVLSGLRVLRRGDSHAGHLLAGLLTDQGAVVVGSAEAGAVDVVIDEGADPSFDEVARRNDRLVHCTLTGLPGGGPDDVELADTPIAALLGLHALSGSPPRAEPLPVAAFYGAVVAAVHIVAALIAREDEPHPVHLEVSLLAAAATALSRERIEVTDIVDIATLPHLPHVELYECADGRYLQPHGLYAEFVRVLCRVAGRPEWAEEAVAALGRLPDRAAEEAWRERLRVVFRERPALDWERDINAAGGAATMSRTAAEWSAEPHATAAAILDGPAVRVSPVTGAPRPVTFSRQPGTPPLTGIRVIDFCIVLAGPTCARVLADLGADVVKVDDPRRPVSPYPWLDVNRSKRSTVVDLATADGAEVVRRLIAGADVVVQNFRAGKIDKLGFGAGDVRRDRSDLVYASLNAFDFDGPWQERAGWEHNAQAATGMQWARRRDGLPRQVPFPVNDYATGLLGAFGVCLALLHRRRTGLGAHVRASLARSATHLMRAATEAPPDRYQPVECTDGWVWAAGPATVTGSQADVLRAFREAGVPAVPERDLRQEATRDWLREHAVLVRRRHPRLGWVDQIAPTVSSSGWQAPDGRLAPEPGDDTDAVLAELGLTTDEIGSLRGTAAVAGPIRFR